MVILHASFREGGLWVWGEASPAIPVSSGDRRPWLPFGARTENLVEAINDGFATRSENFQKVLIWMPATGGVPHASDARIARPSQTTAGRPSVRAYKLLAVRMETERCMRFLDTAEQGLTGEDVVWWIAALRFARSLVARGHFLPDLAASAHTALARWIPVFDSEDEDTREKLVAAMPAAAVALTTRDASVPPTITAEYALDAFLACAVDFFPRFNSSKMPPSIWTQEARKHIPGGATPPERWMRSLHSYSGFVRGEREELERLSLDIRSWQRPIQDLLAFPWTLSLRLEEPAADSDKWFVRYLLDSANEAGTQLSGPQAWRSEFREQFLVALRRASKACPPIAETLLAEAPEGFETDTEGAYDFLATQAQLLREAGCTVLLPAWWLNRDSSVPAISARAVLRTAAMRGAGNLSLEDLVAFDWQVALGGQDVTEEELAALVEHKAPLVRVRGQWVEVTAKQLKAALDLWARREKETTLGDAMRVALGGFELPRNIQFRGVSAEGWIADLLDQLQGSIQFEQLPSPEGFCGELRPYQARGFSWLAFLRRWGLGACLADDMGLGKTIQALALLQRDWESGGDRRPALLVCPTSVVGNWRKEAARFTPRLPVLVHHGADRAKGEEFADEAARHALVISSYSLLHRDIDMLSQVHWAGVILDEAQNIKNPDTKQARAARALPAGYHIALTGTPVENHVGELWSIMQFLNPGFLGGQTEFRRSFFAPIQNERDSEAIARLKRLTGPFVLRRLKTDKTVIADLPQKLEMKVFCNLTREQASLYAAVVEDMTRKVADTRGIQRKGLVLATLSKLKQICNHPAQFLRDRKGLSGRSGKLARLTEMLEEVLDSGDKALVFSQFAEMGELLQRHLKEEFGQEVLFLHGGTPAAKRQEMVDTFQGNGHSPRLFVLSLKAGGTGVNLTAANHVFHFDRWWNPAVENQATDRAYRIGQERNVQVHKFLCVGTLEEKIDEMIESKRAVAENVVGTGEGWLTELSTDELRDLFALRREAIAD